MTSPKKPATPATIAVVMMFDFPLALSELVGMDIVNVPEPPELDAEVLELDPVMLELDVTDAAAGDEAPARVVESIRLVLDADIIYDKDKEDGWYSQNGGTYVGGHDSITIIWWRDTKFGCLGQDSLRRNN